MEANSFAKRAGPREQIIGDVARSGEPWLSDRCSRLEPVETFANLGAGTD